MATEREAPLSDEEREQLRQLGERMGRCPDTRRRAQTALRSAYDSWPPPPPSAPAVVTPQPARPPRRRQARPPWWLTIAAMFRIVLVAALLGAAGCCPSRVSAAADRARVETLGPALLD